jgi:hypothetical protein
MRECSFFFFRNSQHRRPRAPERTGDLAIGGGGAEFSAPPKIDYRGTRDRVVTQSKLTLTAQCRADFAKTYVGVALLYVTRIIVAVTGSLYSKSFGPELAVTELPLRRADVTARRRNPLVRIARKITSYGCNELGGSLRETRRVSFVY